jgi:hypothetical protein
MTGCNVSDFVSQNSGKFGFGICLQGQSAGDIYVTSRKGECIDHGRIKDGKPEIHIRLLGILRYLFADTVNVIDKIGVPVLTEKLDNFCMLLCSDCPFLLRRHKSCELLFAGSRIYRARR